MGWGPVLASLQVPELTMEDFLSESQSGGCFLTLYAFVLQRLNAEHTAANDRRTLALLNSWSHQVDPRWVLVSRPHVLLQNFKGLNIPGSDPVWNMGDASRSPSQR